MALTSAVLLPATAATRVDTYEQAQAKLNDDGYLVFIYGRGWDKRAEAATRELYNNPAVAQAAGKAAMMLLPLPESMTDTEKKQLETTLGKLQLPHVHSKHSFPAIVMYDKSGRQYSIICGPPMVYPDANRIARILTVRRQAKTRQDTLLAAADKAQGEERARLLLQAAQVQNIERPHDIANLIKKADPEDKAGCLAALNFYNNPVGDAINKMPITEALAEMDKAISNPLHTIQQKQNACAFAIGLIRRRIGSGGAEAIRHYAGIMRDLNPDSVLGRSALVVMRDWTTGLQYARGWSPESLPIKGISTELQGRLPIGEAGTYEVQFIPTGGDKAIISRVALYDGDTLLAEDVRTTAIADNGQAHIYTVTAPAAVKNPHLFITFENAENDRNTRGKITITRK